MLHELGGLAGLVAGEGEDHIGSLRSRETFHQWRGGCASAHEFKAAGSEVSECRERASMPGTLSFFFRASTFFFLPVAMSSACRLSGQDVLSAQ